MRKTDTRILAAVLCVGVSGPALAQERAQQKFEINAQAVIQYIVDENADLGTGSADTQDSLSEQLQLSADYHPYDLTQVYAYGRALHIDGDSGFEDDTGQTQSGTDQDFLELRQLWVRRSEILGITPLDIQIGRQRVTEPRALWWNSDLDLVRLNYDTTQFRGFVGAGQTLASYRTSTDDDFTEEDEDRFRLLGEGSWQYRHGQFLEGRFLYENDHSDGVSTGSSVAANDFDDEDLEAAWIGARARGQTETGISTLGALRYRADVIGLAGEVDELETAAGGSPDTRTVTGSRTNDLRAWAFDGGVSVSPQIMGRRPALHLNYAYGSGDDDPADGTDHAFRQTDLEGNSSRIGLERTQQRNYGEVLRPELSNIHIASAGIGVPLGEHMDVGATYFHYRLADEASGLRSDGLDAALNGEDKGLGQAVDIGFNVDLDDSLAYRPRHVEDADFRIVAGSFFAGDAWGEGADEEAFRVFTEFKVKF